MGGCSRLQDEDFGRYGSARLAADGGRFVHGQMKAAGGGWGGGLFTDPG